MFDFLFKRSANKASAAAAASAAQTAAAAASVQAQAQTDLAQRRARQLAQAGALAGDPAAAAAFVLHSEYADARLAAAAHVHGQPLLEQVYQAMRNTDRRVAKLMQSRLDLLRHEQAEQQRAEACVTSAERLLADEKLSPNQVAELDRQWQVVQAGPDMAARFAPLRASLAQRLADQVQLQRAVIDALAEVRALAADALAAGAGDTLQRLAGARAGYVASAEVATLPKHLLTEFDAAYDQAAVILRARAAEQAGYQAAYDARLAALAGWQAAAAAAATFAARVDADAAPAVDTAIAPTDEAVVQHSIPPDGEPVTPPSIAPVSAVAVAPAPAPLLASQLSRAWQRLPHVPESHPLAAQLQQQFDALLATLPAEPSAMPAPARLQRKEATRVAPKEAEPAFLAALDGMEAALQQGLLQQASEHDKVLRDSKPARLAPDQAERLAGLLAEFKRLADWARWGGNVSREELVKAADELAGQELGMVELAKKVGSLRERWKSLDTLSGSAPKTLWERFDAACSTAYAPAAAHFKQLGEERQHNAQKAQELIAAVQAEAAALEAGDIDWKHLAASVQRQRQAWGRFGAIDRKDRKRLDTEFNAALAQLAAPLEQQRQIEVARREQLVAEVGLLNPLDRNTVDMLRALQDKWQELAKALPLERRTEQQLWLRFRAACDDVFAKRKETAHAADNERRTQLEAKEALCASLEATPMPAAGDDKRQAAAIAAALRAARSAWNAIGAVPRASEQAIEQRFQAALALLQGQADDIAQRAGAAQAHALRDKLRLCQAVELALAGDTPVPAADWSALPPLEPQFERVLLARHSAALAAFDNGRDAYVALLEANRATLLDEVLRLEIVAGVDSGAEFARARLKMQVEVLQSSLKSGQKPASQLSQLVQLCAIPALADSRTGSRIEVLLRRIGGGQEA